ncbi:hypothetical protein [Absidia glauca]|uniref:Kinesin-like protein n=1 Tax=Absidia glauca TaxID=4829 RepID=A0A168L0N6_ABSGL|nr:hypothetical protein [Absidia glauca]
MTSDDTNVPPATDRGVSHASTGATNSSFQRPSRSQSTTANQPLIEGKHQEGMVLSSSTTTSPSTTTFSAPPQPRKNPVQAYLRIRPLSPTQVVDSSSYLKVLDDEWVSLIPPQDSHAYRKRQGASDQYQFTKVFTNNTNQQQLFEETTLPLLQYFLHGNNALIFAYGVTNSGKTYTMLGNKTEAGIVPRTIQCLFSALQDRLSQSLLKPVMHGSIQAYELDPRNDSHENRSLLLDNDVHTPDYTMDTSNDTANRLEVDAGFEYGIWVSFAEIYNEKVYDLLESPSKKQTKRPSLPLKYEYRSGYKYVAGLKNVRVKTAKEAYTVIQKGQQNRVVFSTQMNQSSSRSHSIFTISLIRCPVDSADYVIEDPAYATMSKLSIVDLAGSERYRNTFNQGQRLKEAGNINKSLMVLGQCMEALRLNQLKIESGRRPGVVPFRQSKLTELFKNTFESDGKVAIVVNVNPFDTGFDENSGVMKFAAIAKEVTTVQQQKQQKLPLSEMSETALKRLRRNTTESKNELDPRINLDNACQHCDGALIKTLLEQLDSLRNKWLDAEKRYATLESDTRRQVSMETNVEAEKWRDMYMSLLKQKSDTIGARIGHPMNDIVPEETNDRVSLASLEAQQQQLSSEIDKLHALSKEYDKERQTLLEKIDHMELGIKLEELTTSNLPSNHLASDPLNGSTFAARELQRSDSGATQYSGSDDRYGTFLDLRKQLRRSVFKRDELPEDAEGILNQIEQFEGVTFDLVKNTKMGKLLKLITQEEFKSDPYSIQQRALDLFKRFARLPRPIATTTQLHQDTMALDPTEDTLMEDFMDRLNDEGTDDDGRTNNPPLLSQKKATEIELQWHDQVTDDDEDLHASPGHQGTDDSDTSVACDSRKSPSRKRRSLDASTKHPHLTQINNTLKDVKESLKETVKHVGVSHEQHDKRPQDGKTNPME